MKKLLFALLFMTTVSLSFCKKKECELKNDTEIYTSAYIETDNLSGFKGKNTLTFSNTYSFKVSVGGDCIYGAKSECLSTSFNVLNLTNKSVTIKVFISEEAATLNQTPTVILNCSPNGVEKVSSGLGFLRRPCGADLSSLVRVSYT
jgi:hypothetical protein